MLDDWQKTTRERMQKARLSLTEAFGRIRTGRAQPGLLDSVMVNVYDQSMPLKQLASIVATDPRTLTVTPWDKATLQAIEKALRSSDLGLNPVVTGTLIRLPLPSLNEERRRELVRVVRHESESARVAVRNIRRDALGRLKQALKDKEMTEDEERRAEELLQKMTDELIQEIDQELVRKEAELMEV